MKATSLLFTALMLRLVPNRRRAFAAHVPRLGAQNASGRPLMNIKASGVEPGRRQLN
jgi:hypothetical protein